MLLATYQSSEYLREVQDYYGSGIVIPKSSYGVSNFLFQKVLGYNPVFCIPVLDMKSDMDKTLFEFIKVAPTNPQELIIFETENYDVFSYKDWAVHCTYGTEKLRINLECAGLSKEYIVRGIDKQSIRQITYISGASHDDFVWSSSDDAAEHLYTGGVIQCLSKIIEGYSNYNIKDISSLTDIEQKEFMRLYVRVVDIGHTDIENIKLDIMEQDINKLYNFCIKHLIKLV